LPHARPTAPGTWRNSTVMAGMEWPAGMLGGLCRIDAAGTIHPDDAVEMERAVREVIGCTCHPLFFVTLERSPGVALGEIVEGVATIHSRHEYYCASLQPLGGL
jgi:hypothetical protein